MSYRDPLISLIREKALRFGDFTLASGKKARFYLDCREVTLDSAGARLIGEAMRILHGQKHSAAVIGVSTVQEEIGSIGARTSAFHTEPDMAIVVDVGHATDHPGLDKKKEGDYSLGKGPILSRGANVNPVAFDMLVETAEREGIPYQTEGIGGRSATDADSIQYSRAGVAAGLIHVPLRYMHSPCEVISLTDLENTAKLIAAFIAALKPDTCFIPR